jgi:radical SAM protein with 4Fe4S-binding SPASM domain
VKAGKDQQESEAERGACALPAAIAAEVKACARAFDSANGKSVKYLWIYVTDHSGSPGKDEERRGALTIDEWLSVIDEGASLGAECVVIGLGAPLAQHPEVAEICRWAQAAHEMMVGLHVHREPLTQAEIQQIKELDPAKTRVFVDKDHMDAMQLAQDMGLSLLEADGYEIGSHETSCTLPGEMTCIGAQGDLYTCGLVLGEKQYNLGHFFDRRLEQVMADGALPHEVSYETREPRKKCGGCPPRLAGLLRPEEPQ